MIAWAADLQQIDVLLIPQKAGFISISSSNFADWHFCSGLPVNIFAGPANHFDLFTELFTIDPYMYVLQKVNAGFASL